MGIRITDDDACALYDSVTDTAFGPIFESREDAELFMQWYYRKTQRDLRLLTDAELQNYYSLWLMEKVNYVNNG